jgi:GAF domain-containing protein
MTSRIALELDMAQYDAHDGPCLSSFRSRHTLRLDVADGGDSFPHFSRVAELSGVKGVLSVPALWGNDIVGTMNLYSRIGPFDQTAETVAAVLATQVTIAISRSPEFVAARTVVEQAQRDLEDQAKISVATGLLMVNEACAADQAEALLRSAAAQDERTIVEIAERIIDQHSRSR